MIQARLAISPCCRYLSRSASVQPSLSDLAGSSPISARVRQTSSLCPFIDKVAAPNPAPAVSGWGAWPLRPIDQFLDLLAVSRLPFESALHFPHFFSGLRMAMQRGTPLGHERRYSWKATAGRSEASSPPTLDHRDRSEPTLDDQYDSAGDKVPVVETEDGPAKPMKRPRPSVAPQLLAGAAAKSSVGLDNAAPDLGPQPLSPAGSGRGSLAEPPQAMWRSAYYVEDNMDAGSPEASNVDALSGHFLAQ